MSQTYQPSSIRRKRRHGFLKKNESVNGQAVLKRRRNKGRKRLTTV
jgi:large subunit ribosomal protein L34